ncbi:MAG: hypothetical protein LBK61_04595 [Spirochaetaceae bacterium]|jgi:hypothetical protein|nr:hypothetical protein [Spirochaetaceae bacterium]
MKESKDKIKGIISTAVQAASDAINQKWPFLNVTLPSNQVCPEYQQCVKFEVYVFILVYFKFLLPDNASLKEAETCISEAIESEIKNEFQVDITRKNIDERIKLYSVSVDSSRKKNNELHRPNTDLNAINATFFGLLKRISTTGSLHEYINFDINKNGEFFPFHIFDLALSNSLNDIFNIMARLVFEAVLVNSGEGVTLASTKTGAAGGWE